MKSELNDYKITNSDGIIKYDNEGKIHFDNDDSHYIEENSLSSQDENFSANESLNIEKEDKTVNQKTSNDVSKTTSQASTASTSTATSTAASSTSAISSSIGSVIGGVVSSVATAVIVVVAFISMLTINVSLVMASTNCLVFQLEMIGAQQEDFENKAYYAILEGEGYSQSQEIFMDSVYITFEDLEPGTEYTITIKNDEKVFVEKSYITATNDIQRGFIEAWNEEENVCAFVSVRELKSDEFYTFTITNGSGKVIFQDSDIEPEKEYSFDIESSDTLTFTLSINGKVCCFQQLQIELEEDDHDEDHEHNYIPRGFVWNYDDESEDWVAVGEGICEDCEDVLTIPAQMSRDGDVIVATITYNGTTYTDKHVEIDLTNKENIISDDNCYYLKAYSFVLGNLDSGTSVSYTNSEDYPYIIKGTADQLSNSMIVYNRFVTKGEYYIEFNNLDIVAYENSTILNVQTASDVTIHIVIRGDVSLITNGSHCFNVENTGRDSDITVTFDITFIDSDCSFYCFDELLEATNLYNAQAEANIVFNINDIQVDSRGEPIDDEDGPEISLSEGRIYINAYGYARQENDLSNPVEFVSFETNPYMIQELERHGCDNIINVYQTDSSIQTADIYIKLKNVTIEAGDYCSLFRIMARNTLNIYLIIEGNVTFRGGEDQQIFSSQGSNSPTVNIIIDQTTCGGIFNAEISDGLTYAESGTINVRYV